MSAYLVRFNERRPNGRTRAMKVQRVGPVEHVGQVWEWVAGILKGSTPEVLARLHEVKVSAEVVGTAPVPEEGQ